MDNSSVPKRKTPEKNPVLLRFHFGTLSHPWEQSHGAVADEGTLWSLLREPRRILDDLPRHLGEVGRAGHGEASPNCGVKKGEPKLLQQDISRENLQRLLPKNTSRAPNKLAKKI